MENLSFGYVYVIESSDGLFKIGHSKNNPHKRLIALQIGSPHRLSIAFTLRTPFYVEIERDLHKRYAAKRVRGEWFALEENDFLYMRLLNWSGDIRTDYLEGAARARARNEARSQTAGTS